MFEKRPRPLFKRIIDFYLRYSFHVALGIYCFYKVFEYTLKQNKDLSFEIIVFFGSIVAYNFLKYPRFLLIKTHRQSFEQNLGMFVTFLALCISFITFVNMTPGRQLSLLLSGIGVLLYPLLRPFGIWKMFIVALVVAWTCIGVPFLNQLPFQKLILSLLNALMILWIWLIPFEIYDRKNDQLLKPTLAQRLALIPFKIIGLSCLIFWFFLNVWMSGPFISTVVITVCTALALLLTNDEKSYYFTALGVESLPVLWYICLLALD